MAIGWSAGFYLAQWMARDSNGYPKGVSTTPDSVSNGSTHHAYVLTGPVEATEPTASYDSATAHGGMKQLGRIELGLQDMSPFNLRLTHFDPVFDGYVSGLAPETTNGGTANVITTPNHNRATPPQGILALTSGYQTTAGVNRFRTRFFLNVTMRRLPGSITQAGGENPQPVTYLVTPSQSLRTPFGLFSGFSSPPEDNSDYYVDFLSTYRPAITTYIDDGTATSFVVGYRPATSDNDNSINVFSKNGADAASQVSAFSTTTGAATITAGSAGDIWVAVYGTLLRAI